MRSWRSLKPALALSAMVVMPANGLLWSVGQEKAAPQKSQATTMPKYEHFAFCCVEGYLDGPSKEAMSSVTKSPSVDDEGNFFFVPAHGDGCLRVARMDGVVQTIAGGDYWQGAIAAEEGPASCIPHLQREGGIGNPTSTCLAIGAPLKDKGDGQPAGFLITRAGHGTGLENYIYKVWRNKEKGGRWWFKVITGTGAKSPPTKVGTSVPAKDVRFANLPFITRRKLVNGRVEVLFHSQGNVWVYDDDKGTLTCVLSAADYMQADIWKSLRHDGKPVTQPPFRIAGLPDGSFILNTYQETYPRGCVLHVSADGKEVRLVCTDAGDVNRRWDGDGLKEAAFFGGPLLAGGVRAGVVGLGAVDDAPLRRLTLKDGRVSTLCKDGEWREFPTKRAAGGGELTWFQCPPDKAPAWGRGWVMAGDYFYQIYCMGGGDAWVWRVGPIDWTKPTLKNR